MYDRADRSAPAERRCGTGIASASILAMQLYILPNPCSGQGCGLSLLIRLHHTLLYDLYNNIYIVMYISLFWWRPKCVCDLNYEKSLLNARAPEGRQAPDIALGVSVDMHDILAQAKHRVVPAAYRAGADG